MTRGWIPTVPVLLLGAVVALAAACPSPDLDSEPDLDPDRDPPREPGDPAAISCRDFVEGGLAVRARSREEFRSELGEPVRVESETEPNRHDPTVTDTLFRLEYPGLAARIRRPAGLDDLLERVEVTNDRHLTYPRLGIGAEVEAVVAALGEPDGRTDPRADSRPESRADSRADARLRYDCDPHPGPTEPVWFLVEDGRVAEVHFTFYVD